MNPTRAHLFPQDTHKIKKFEKNEKTLFKSGFIFQNHGFLWDSGNIVKEKNTKKGDRFDSFFGIRPVILQESCRANRVRASLLFTYCFEAAGFWCCGRDWRAGFGAACMTGWGDGCDWNGGF